MLRRQLTVFGFYLGVAALALYTLVFHMMTHIPGEFTTDYFHFHWNYWWMREALSSPSLEVYRTNYVMFPAESNLALHTMAPIWFPVWGIVEPILNNKAAFAAIYLLALSLTGYTFYVLARRFSVSIPFALMGGVLLMLSPGQMNAVYMSTVHYLCFMWLPLNLLFWQQISIHVEHRWKAWFWTILMALSLWGLIMTDLQGPIYSAFLLVPFGVLTLVQAKRNGNRLRLVGYGAASIACASILLWIVGPLRYILSFELETLAPGDPASAFEIPFPLGFVSRLPEYWLTHIGISYGVVIVPLFVIVALMAVAARTGKDSRWFWFALSLPPLILSAGATITLFGADIPMPYRLLHALFGGIFRQPVRLSTVFFIPALIFIGLVLSEWLRSRPRLSYSIPVIMLLTVAVDVRLYEPFPIQPGPPIYSFYEDMAADGLDYGVLDVPTAAASGEWGVGTPDSLRTQYAALVHHKKVVNGLIARVEPWSYLYMETSDPVMAWLGQRRYLEPEVVADQLGAMIRDWPIGYIIVHTDLIGYEQTAVQEVIGFLNQQPELVCPYRVDGAAIAYRTRWHPAGCEPRSPGQLEDGSYQIDIGTADDRRFLGWGWYFPEDVAGLSVRWLGDQRQLVLGQEGWTDEAAHQANFFVDLPLVDMKLTLSAQAFYEPRSVTLYVNGTEIGNQVISPDGLQTITFDIPAQVLEEGSHVEINLQYDGTISAAEAGLSNDTRQLAIMVDWVRFSHAEY